MIQQNVELSADIKFRALTEIDVLGDTGVDIKVRRTAAGVASLIPQRLHWVHASGAPSREITGQEGYRD